MGQVQGAGSKPSTCGFANFEAFSTSRSRQNLCTKLERPAVIVPPPPLSDPPTPTRPSPRHFPTASPPLFGRLPTTFRPPPCHQKVAVRTKVAVSSPPHSGCHFLPGQGRRAVKNRPRTVGSRPKSGRELTATFWPPLFGSLPRLPATIGAADPAPPQADPLPPSGRTSPPRFSPLVGPPFTDKNLPLAARPTLRLAHGPRRVYISGCGNVLT